MLKLVIGMIAPILLTLSQIQGALALESSLQTTEPNNVVTSVELSQKFQNNAPDKQYRLYDFDINGDGISDKLVIEHYLNQQSNRTLVFIYSGMDEMHYTEHSVINNLNPNGRFTILDIIPRKNFKGFILFTIESHKNSPFLTFYLDHINDHWVISKFSASAENLEEKFSYKCLYEDLLGYDFSVINNIPSQDSRSKSQLLTECPPDPVLGAFYEITTKTEVFDENFHSSLPPTFLEAGTIVESFNRNEDWIAVTPPVYLHGVNPVRKPGWVNRDHVKQREDISP